MIIIYKDDMLNSISDYYAHEHYTKDKIIFIWSKVYEILRDQALHGHFNESDRTIHCIEDLTDEEFDVLDDWVFNQDF